MAVSFRRSAIARVCLSMHTYSVTYEGSPNNTPGSSSYVPCLTFAPGQNESNQTVEQRIGPLVAERTSRRRFFYGIEVTANEMGGGPPVCLNFNHFLPLLPTFVSVVWLNQRYWDVEPIGQVRSLQMAKHLATHIPVLPHLTAFRLSERRLNQFLDLNFSSILAVRGDQVHEDQRFRLALPMIEHLRQQRENISICVGGYPEGYTNLGDFPPAFTKNIAFLKKKVIAGADCIITQICYDSEAIVQFIKDCRAAGITVPILVGLTPHESFRSYLMMENVANVRLPTDLRRLLDDQRGIPIRDTLTEEDPVKKFFINLTVKIVRDVLDADLGIWGFHFFTLNQFKLVQEVLQELRNLNVIEDGDQNGKQD